MIRMKLSFCLTLALAFAFSAPPAATSQHHPPQFPSGRSQGFYITTFTGVSPDSGKSRVAVMYRFPRNFLVFTRDAGEGANGYTARCDISFELHDAKGSPVVQRLTTRTFHSADNAERAPDTLSYAGGFNFDIDPGEFSARFEATDVESKRMYRDDSLAVSVPKFLSDSLALSGLLLTSLPADSLAGTLAPLNYGTTIPFGSRPQGVVQLYLPPGSAPAKIVIEMYRHAGEQTPRQLVLRDSVPPERLRPAAEYTVDEQSGALIPGSRTVPRVSMASFPLALDTLQQGNYMLEVVCSSGAITRTTRQHVTLRWIGMPVSLRSLATAIAPMKYILPEEEYDNLSSAGPEEQIVLFEAYWKKHDTSPLTAFNEMMEEFYKRVDHAAASYATLREPNGVRSDRGKVYILYGPPEHVDRRLLPSAPPQEIWLYERLKKKVLFLDPTHSGDYKLLSMEAM
jgi:GWxTD domain-containing protein